MTTPKRALTAILLDDNGAEAFLLARRAKQLEWLDLELKHFSQPQGALNELLVRPPDLIFLDHHLGGRTTGLEILRELREVGFDGPVVVLTGTDDPRTIEDFLRFGADAYLHKADMDTGKFSAAIQVALTLPHKLAARIRNDEARRR